MFIVTFVIGFLTLILFTLYERYSHAGKLIRKIPGPKSWPIVGNARTYSVPPDQLFYLQRSLQKDYGHMNQIHGFNTRLVNISNPEDIEKIVTSTEFNHKKDPYTFLVPWLSNGLLVSSGKMWHNRRKMLTKAFHFNVLKKYLEVFITATEDLLKRVEEETQKEHTDVLSLISPSALRIMCETAMGISMDEDSTAFKKYFNAIFGIGLCFALRMSKVWLYSDVLFNLSSIAPKQKQVLADLHEFTSNVIEERRKMFENNSDVNTGLNENEKLAMLDLLLENEKAGLINNKGIQEEVDTFMFEGFDTTSMSLTYMIMVIANEPIAQDKLREEMDRIFRDSKRLPTMEDLNEMKYLECCIKEMMRLYPAAPVVARHLVKDTILSGYTVPANTTCFLYIYDLHHRADLFPDPERFDPDQFLPENSLKRNSYTYIPFSAGIRNCIGQKFAILELKVAMSGLLRRYRLEPVTRPCDLHYIFDLVLRTKDPIRVRFRLRK